MTNEKKIGAFARAGRRVAAVTVLAAVSLSLIGTAAQAMPNDGWYRCWVSDHGWMWCQDV
ncbi:hypothetical protein ACWGH8_08870 [Nonomuraea muscovyensis]|uniref:Uncharacterized protein n=1 Tax=Nonomuraea muscovyensis TaxID=1124761 RepID=A0A7X0BZH4_9ACTN|nr:hypothetical protein [Nonomuraea muscovyensis]MBB6345553.1 hypothetical protein [Nonomuraea muscovyensis]MDF2705940.1 hypothetical protein [Nonomuraea muscovyensis]